MIKCIVIFPNGNISTEEFKTMTSIKEYLNGDVEEYEVEYWNLKFRGYAHNYKDNVKADFSILGYCLFDKEVFGKIVIPYITPVKTHFIEEVHNALYDTEDTDSILEILGNKVGRVVFKQNENTNIPILRVENDKFILPLESIESSDVDRDKVFINRTFLEESIGKHSKLKAYSVILGISILLSYCISVTTHLWILMLLVGVPVFLILSDIYLRVHIKKIDTLYSEYMTKLFSVKNLNIGGVKDD